MKRSVECQARIKATISNLQSVVKRPTNRLCFGSAGVTQGCFFFSSRWCISHLKVSAASASTVTEQHHDPMRPHSDRPVQGHQDRGSGDHQQAVQRAYLRAGPLGDLQRGRHQLGQVPPGPQSLRTGLQHSVDRESPGSASMCCAVYTVFYLIEGCPYTTT